MHSRVLALSLAASWTGCRTPMASMSLDNHQRSAGLRSVCLMSHTHVHHYKHGNRQERSRQMTSPNQDEMATATANALAGQRCCCALPDLQKIAGATAEVVQETDPEV